MGIEIEAKMRVADLAAVRGRLKSAGAKLIGNRVETNIFFDTPDANLRDADKGLRLRANRDVKTGSTEYVVTYKGPRRRGKLKTRQEIEFSVEDPDALTEVFENLGLKICINFQKRRESWKLQGCKVELDELPLLGSFVEIEGPSAQLVMKVRKLLAMADLPMINDSYAALMARQRSSVRRIEFSH